MTHSCIWNSPLKLKVKILMIFFVYIQNDILILDVSILSLDNIQENPDDYYLMHNSNPFLLRWLLSFGVS